MKPEPNKPEQLRTGDEISKTANDLNKKLQSDPHEIHELPESDQFGQSKYWGSTPFEDGEKFK